MMTSHSAMLTFLSSLETSLQHLRMELSHHNSNVMPELVVTNFLYRCVHRISFLPSFVYSGRNISSAIRQVFLERQRTHAYPTGAPGPFSKFFSVIFFFIWRPSCSFTLVSEYVLFCSFHDLCCACICFHRLVFIL